MLLSPWTQVNTLLSKTDAIFSKPAKTVKKFQYLNHRKNLQCLNVHFSSMKVHRSDMEMRHCEIINYILIWLFILLTWVSPALGGWVTRQPKLFHPFVNSIEAFPLASFTDPENIDLCLYHAGETYHPSAAPTQNRDAKCNPNPTNPANMKKKN